MCRLTQDKRTSEYTTAQAATEVQSISQPISQPTSQPIIQLASRPIMTDKRIERKTDKPIGSWSGRHQADRQTDRLTGSQASELIILTENR